MRRRSRWLRVAKWGGVVVCVLLLAIYAASARWYLIAWTTNRYYRSLAIGAGSVQVRWSVDPWVGPARGSWGISGHHVPLIWTPEVSRKPMPRSQVVHVTIGIPIWILLSIIAIPTVVLWRLDRRRTLLGHCRCGYDLTGNVSGRCPECGRTYASSRESP